MGIPRLDSSKPPSPYFSTIGASYEKAIDQIAVEHSSLNAVAIDSRDNYGRARKPPVGCDQNRMRIQLHNGDCGGRQCWGDWSPRGCELGRGRLFPWDWNAKLKRLWLSCLARNRGRFGYFWALFRSFWSAF